MRTLFTIVSPIWLSMTNRKMTDKQTPENNNSFLPVESAMNPEINMSGYNMKYRLLILTLFAAVSFLPQPAYCFDYYLVTGPDQFEPAGPQQYPGHYQSYVDEAYGTTIRRITDAETRVRPNYVAKQHSIENSDGSMLYVGHRGKSNGAIYTTSDGIYRTSIDQYNDAYDNFCWSSTTPNVGYLFTGGSRAVNAKFYKVTIDTVNWQVSYQLLREITASDFPGQNSKGETFVLARIHDEGPTSWDGRHWAVIAQYEGDYLNENSASFLGWLDKDLNGVDSPGFRGTMAIPGNLAYNAGMSPGGNYIFFRSWESKECCAGTSGSCAWSYPRSVFTGTVDWRDGNMLGGPMGYHYALAYDDLGNEVYVTSAGGGRVGYWIFNKPGNENRVIAVESTDWIHSMGRYEVNGFGDSHFGTVGVAPGAREWIALLPTDSNGSNKDECGYEYQGASTITFAKLSATDKTIWRVAHARNDAGGYVYQLFSGGSRDGRSFYYNSNWCNQSNDPEGPRMQLFRAELPTDWWEEILDHKVIFETDFDDCTDWTVAQGDSNTSNLYPAYGYGETNFPDSFTGYDGAKYIGWYDSRTYLTANQHNTIVLDASHSRAKDGKAVTHWTEVPLTASDGEASDGTLYISLTDQPGDPTKGYNEIWITLWRQYDPNYYTDQNMQKYLKVSSYNSAEGGLSDWFGNVHLPKITAGTQGANNVDSEGNKLRWFYGSIKLFPAANRNDYVFQEEDLDQGIFKQGGTGAIQTYATLSSGTQHGGWQNQGNYGDGNWHLHEWHVKMNSAPGVSDGVYEYFIDKVSQHSVDNIPFIASGTQMNKWNVVVLGGNNDYYDRNGEYETWYAYDDVVISTYRLPSGYFSRCNDGICDPGECDNCIADCNLTECCGTQGCNPNIGENCNNCVTDCLHTGQVCCSGVSYVGDCCEDDECTSGLECNNHVCSPPDVTPPQIISPNANPTSITAEITWQTDEPATSRVEFGTTASYGHFEEDLTLRRSHSLELAGLEMDTLYFFMITSSDEKGNTNTYQGQFNTLFESQLDSLHVDDEGNIIIITSGAPSGGNFKIVFQRDEYAGIRRWYDLTNDPSATENLAYDYQGLSNKSDGNPNTLQITENTQTRICINATSNLSGFPDRNFNYCIYPSGEIYIKRTDFSDITLSGIQIGCLQLGINSNDWDWLKDNDGSRYDEETYWVAASKTDKGSVLDSIYNADDEFQFTYSYESNLKYISFRNYLTWHADVSSSIIHRIMIRPSGLHTESINDEYTSEYRNPAALLFTTGNGGNYNGAEGCYELQAVGNQFNFIFEAGSYTRRNPAFKVSNWTGSAPDTIAVGSTTKERGIDYNADKIDSNTMILQYFDEIATSTSFKAYGQSSQAGDINNDKSIDLVDLILALKIAAGTAVPVVFQSADVDADNKIGMEEAIFILQNLANK